MFEMNMSIIIIILVIIVISIIVGYSLVRFIDDKLSSVVVNVPQQDYKLPPIYLVDKDSNIKRIKLNDVVSSHLTENETEEIQDNETTTVTQINLDDIIEDEDFDYETVDQAPHSRTDETESFGNLKVNPTNYEQDRQAFLGGQTSDKKTKEPYYDIPDPNFNMLNDIPLLVSPDIVSPNMKFGPSYPYYSNKAKLVDKKDSQLVQLQDMYLKKIDRQLKKAKKNKKKEMLTEKFINGPFDGYNSHVNLKEDSYANVTSLGKSLLTPYTSYPVPS